MQLWILPLTYDSKVSFLIQIPKWSMPCILKHACPSHQKNEATRSSLEDKPLWSMKLCPCLGGYPLTPLTTISIVPCLSFDWWSSVLVWWCLVLWPCLIRFFALIVGVLWVFYLRWHQLPSWVLLLDPPHPCRPYSFSAEQMEEAKKKSWRQHRHRLQQTEAIVTIVIEVSWRKEDLTLLFFPPCACYYPIYLTLTMTPATKKDED